MTPIVDTRIHDSPRIDEVGQLRNHGLVPPKANVNVIVLRIRIVEWQSEVFLVIHDFGQCGPRQCVAVVGGVAGFDFGDGHTKNEVWIGWDSPRPGRGQ